MAPQFRHQTGGIWVPLLAALLVDVMVTSLNPVAVAGTRRSLCHVVLGTPYHVGCILRVSSCQQAKAAPPACPPVGGRGTRYTEAGRGRKLDREGPATGQCGARSPCLVCSAALWNGWVEAAAPSSVVARGSSETT